MDIILEILGIALLFVGALLMPVPKLYKKYNANAIITIAMLLSLVGIALIVIS